MGRYYPDDQGPGSNDIWSNLNANMSKVGDVYLNQQIKQQDQKQKMKQIIQAALLKNMMLKPGADPNRIVQDSGDVDFSQLQNAPKEKPASTSISISQRPFEEVLKARDEVARTPQDWLKAGMATEGDVQPGSGWFGSNFLGKKNIKLSPEADQVVSQARNILGNPNRVTQKISNAGSSVLGQGSQSNGIDVSTDDNNLPDASGYEEGTIVQDDSGTKYKVVNGEWVSA